MLYMFLLYFGSGVAAFEELLRFVINAWRKVARNAFKVSKSDEYARLIVQAQVRCNIRQIKKKHIVEFHMVGPPAIAADAVKYPSSPRHRRPP